MSVEDTMEREETSLEQALGEQLAEAAAELKIRRRVVTAEIMGMVQARLMRAEEGEDLHASHLAPRNRPLPPQLQRYFVDQAAEAVLVLVEGAMSEGAGLPAESAAADPGAPAQPPATAESLGGEA